MKTNGARFLESLNIPFELREYEVDPEDLSAITVAKKIGMPPEQVFKTLLVTGGPNIYRFAVVPGDAELDFKKLARAAGLRKAEMAPLKDVQPLTGYIRGGVTVGPSPLPSTALCAPAFSAASRFSAHASPTPSTSTRPLFCSTRSASPPEHEEPSSSSRPAITCAPRRPSKSKSSSPTSPKTSA